MNKRSYADLMVGVLAYVSLCGLAAIAAGPGGERGFGHDSRWALPVKKRRRRVREDVCRHCAGNGHCEACIPASCRVCRGSGLQPRDATLVPRLTAIWNGSNLT